MVNTLELTKIFWCVFLGGIATGVTYGLIAGLSFDEIFTRIYFTSGGTFVMWVVTKMRMADRR